jgi:hypothetical protein
VQDIPVLTPALGMPGSTGCGLGAGISSSSHRPASYKGASKCVDALIKLPLVQVAKKQAQTNEREAKGELG